MVKIISRKKALKNKYLARLIYAYQQIYNPECDSYMRDEGEYYDEKLDTNRFYSQKELDKLFYKKQKQFNKRRDSIKPILTDYDKTIVLKIKNIEHITKVFTKLCKETDGKSVFIQSYNNSWLNDDFKPLRKSIKKLKGLAVNKNETEAIVVSRKKLKHFIPSFYDLNYSGYFEAYAFFHITNSNIIGSICDHGNIHFHCYSKGTAKKLKSLFKKNLLSSVDNCN